MKIKFTLFYLLLVFSFAAEAQDLTGIWRGYFVSGSGFFAERYKYEIQIFKNPDNSIVGVTYSYKNTDFYAKVNCTGMFTRSSKNLIIKETNTIEIRINPNTDQCNMTCYLTYDKSGKLETLEGTFTSITDQKRECGGGTVYLEKVATSDFKKEDFLVSKPKKNIAPSTKIIKENNTTKPVPKIAIIPKPKKQPPKIITPQEIKPETPDIVIQKPVIPQPASTLPKLTRNRENNLVRTIITKADYIVIDFYDNGEIDNDTITVLHNNQVVAANKRLSHQPINLKFKIDKDHPRHEFIMIAENMGEIPPNTATMIITAGNKRYELSITSTEQKNAAVVIKYDPDDYEQAR